MIKKLVAGFSAWALASSGLLIGKSSSSNDLVFGNYSDYISPKVAQELRKSHKLRLDLFDYDHLVKERFEKGIYDIAITSTSVLSELKSSGAALKLDWNKLIGNGLENNKPKPPEKTVSDARGLFTDIVQDMSLDLLDYGIPYFVQKLGFYYRGGEIESLKGPKTFKELVKAISNEDRFKSKDGKTTIGLIDDPRTVLSFARKVVGKVDVNPNKEDYKNSEEILSDYRELINAGLSRKELGESFLYMTPDSGPLVDALSNQIIQGAFMYNGDGLFAASGGNASLKIKANDFHYVELSENIYFLDFLTFSSKMSEEKQKRAYELAKKLLFLEKAECDKVFREKQEGNGDNCNGQEEEADDEEDDEDQDSENCEDESKSEDEDEETNYEEMAIRNFDYVGYTPTLRTVYDALKNSYFEYGEDSQEQDTENSCKLVSNKTKHEIIKVDKPTTGELAKDYERQLTPKQKSNMLVAYNKFKLLI